MTARHAIYFAPTRSSPWWEFGARWLGRDECNNMTLVQPLPSQLTAAELHAMTAEPRRYGFHATLKAPFRLRQGQSVDDLVARMQALALTLKALPLGPLQAVKLGDFAALVPLVPTDQLVALAATCVTSLDALRAPLSAADLARRNTQRLDARGQELLQLYGYPYVLERFRLHFTLTGPVQVTAAQHVMQAVSAPVALLNLSAPLLLDRLCLFVEAAPNQPFMRITDVLIPP